jgi:hypothetical protein
MVHISPPKLVVGGGHKVLTQRDDEVPEWCNLPLPGQRLRISTDGTVRTVPIDTKRAYRIGGTGDCDVCISELGKTVITLFHHKNGSIYVSACGDFVDSVLKDRVDRVSSRDPGELPDGSQLVVLSGNVKLEVVNRGTRDSIKELLRSNRGSDDDTTRINTVKNSRTRRKRDVLSPVLPGSQTASNACTPLSAVRVHQKPRRGNGVRFLDFD